jgi:predicted O-methyltransferase YrrM
MQGAAEFEGVGSPGRVFGDVDAQFALGALPGPYLPWGSGSMRPAGLVAVCNDVVLNDRRHIVELGSGVSTVMVARLLAQLAGAARRRLVAVEHDGRWRRWVVGQLDAEGIGADVVVVEAPLRPLDDDGGLAWYDEAAVDAAVDAIDLLVIDGPPAHEPGRGLARHRALAVLHERLVPGATIVLDDIERPGEQEVLRRWEDELGLAFRRLDEAGVAIATAPRPAPSRHVSAPR